MFLTVTRPARLLGVALALLIFSSSGATNEAGAAPSEDKAKRARAKLLFDRAEKVYYLGRFNQALELYSKAYEVFSHPGFLFNIGQCHRMLKNYEKAIFFYKGYLQASDASNRKMVLRILKGLEQKLQRKKLPVARVRPRLKVRVVPSRARPAYLPPPSGKPQKRALVRRWWFWTAIGTGAVVVVAAVVGGVLGARQTSGSPDLIPSGSLGTLDRR